MTKMGQMFAFPTREPAIENIYRREFGCVVCKHGIYLPGSTPARFCSRCDELASKELKRILFGD